MPAKRARMLHRDLNREIVSAGAEFIYFEDGKLVSRSYDGKKIRSRALPGGDSLLELHLDTALGWQVSLEQSENAYCLKCIILKSNIVKFQKNFSAHGEPIAVTTCVDQPSVSVWFRSSNEIYEFKFSSSGRMTEQKYEAGEGLPIFGINGQVLRMTSRTPLAPVLHWRNVRDVAIQAYAISKDRLFYVTAGSYGRVNSRDLAKNSLNKSFRIPGMIQTLQADKQRRVWGVTAHRGQERVFAIDQDRVRLGPAMEGKLYLTVTAEGVVIRTRSFRRGLETYSVELRKGGLSMKRLSHTLLSRNKNIHSRTYKLKNGPWIIERHSTSMRPKSLIVHLHGGPDAYEVDDLRFWGMLREYADQGALVISLNYAGSTGFGDQYQRKAWGRWSDSIVSDFAAVLAYAKQKFQVDERSTVVTGWSFGATLGLHLAEKFPRLKGVIAGAPMCDLPAHVARAVEVDSAYGRYFAERFNLSKCGDDFDFKKRLNHKVPVLWLHGTEDEHCSYSEAGQLYRLAVARGLPWQRGTVEEAGHYGSSPADAAKFASFVQDWLKR